MDKETISRKSFLHLAAMLGASPAIASVLSACSSSNSGQSSGSSGEEQSSQASGGESTTSEAAGPNVSRGEAIAQESEVPANSAMAFTDADLGGQPGILIHLQSGKFVAYSAVCTHRGCTVNYQPDTKQLACPCHGSIFDPAQDAAVVQGPAATPLPKIDIAEQNGEVVLT